MSSIRMVDSFISVLVHLGVCLQSRISALFPDLRKPRSDKDEGSRVFSWQLNPLRFSSAFGLFLIARNNCEASRELVFKAFNGSGFEYFGCGLLLKV